MNEYLRFIEALLKDFRESTYTLETKHGLKGFSVKYSSIKAGRTKTLSQSTIAALEKVFNIRIDDSNPSHITYSRNYNTSPEQLERKAPVIFAGSTPTTEYPILGAVYAGEPEMLYRSSYDKTANFTYSKQGHRCFALVVDGKSMESTLKDGSTVLVDMDAPLENGAIVAVKLKNGKQYIKRYEDVNYAFIRLKSDNGDYGERFIDKNDIEAIYRVVEANVKLI